MSRLASKSMRLRDTLWDTEKSALSQLLEWLLTTEVNTFTKPLPTAMGTSLENKTGKKCWKSMTLTSWSSSNVPSWLTTYGSLDPRSLFRRKRSWSISKSAPISRACTSLTTLRRPVLRPWSKRCVALRTTLKTILIKSRTSSCWKNVRRESNTAKSTQEDIWSPLINFWK